jgi:hypothetical protein
LETAAILEEEEAFREAGRSKRDKRKNKDEFFADEEDEDIGFNAAMEEEEEGTEKRKRKQIEDFDDEQDSKETPEQKRLRLAKQYLEVISVIFNSNFSRKLLISIQKEKMEMKSTWRKS